MATSLAIKVDSILVDFLVRTGGLPPLTKAQPQPVVEATQRLNNKLKRLFTGVESVLIQELESRGRISTATDRRAIAQIVEDALDNAPSAVIEEAQKAANIGRRSVISDLQKAGISIGFDDFTPEVVRQLGDQVGPIVEDTKRLMVDNFLQVLQDGYEEGLGIDAVADNLRAEAKQVRDYRLERVARTEINSAQNWGKERSMEELNVEYDQWLTGEDTLVRGHDPEDEFDHVMMHGQVTRVGEPFIHPEQGWQLSYPGAKEGDPGNIINCRCTHRPYVPTGEEIERVRNEISENGYYYP